MIAVVGLYTYIYIIPRVSNIFVETYHAEYGTLEIGEDVSAVLVRSEKVYTADEAGNVERIISEGRLMRKNSRITNVNGIGYYSQQRGTVSYFYDNLEGKLTPDNMKSITESYMDKINEKNSDGEDYSVQECVEGSVQAGDKIFKIVDNSQWYLICWVDKDKADLYKEGGSVVIAFEDGEKVQMTVEQINSQGDRTQLILSCNRYYQFYDKYRTADCKLIRSNRTGIILEADSIVEEDGQEGVYVVNKLGKTNFVPVKILSTDGEKTVVEKNYYYDSEGNTVTTVKNYDEILRTDKES